MASKTNIEWTEITWNPVAGCSVMSEGCRNCYAMRLAARLERMKSEKYNNLTRKSGGRYKWNGKIFLDYASLQTPYSIKKPSKIFVNSMSDLLHEQVPDKFISDVFLVIRENPRHIFQVLTKRSSRLLNLPKDLIWPSNLWMGVSVEDKLTAFRIEDLQKTSAKVKFISFEPLLAPIGLVDLTNINWVIVGGESGPGARKIEREWVVELRDQCVKQNIAFHFKQWGGSNKKKNGRILDDKTWDEFPDA